MFVLLNWNAKQYLVGNNFRGVGFQTACLETVLASAIWQVGNPPHSEMWKSFSKSLAFFF
jgi:hypothetical protein